MKRGVTLALLLLGVIVLPGSAVEPAEPSAEGVEFFEKKIRPLLTAQCHSCHSSGKKVRGGLLLDSRDGFHKGGDSGPAIVPGEPEKSRLIHAIRYTDELRMPPRNKLPDEAIADLTAWVKMGAPWPKDAKAIVTKDRAFDLEALKKHWAFQPVRRPAVPNLRTTTMPIRNPLDAFILARLEKEGLKPASPCEPRVWLRRVTFDLTGLPPTLAEIADFEQATARDPEMARIRVVDRLLAAPAYGERWGRHWLDLMRFAETSGHEFDFDIPEAFGYRDYVIRAFNQDVPYDQFVREHLAGDLLTEPRHRPDTGTNESILGTGFWFLGESKHSPVDIRGDGADRRDNMIDVFGKTFLGLTVACARCHDHKFDPIPTADYYALVGYLQSSRYERVFIDPPETFAGPVQEIRDLRTKAATLAREQTAKVLDDRLQRLPATLRDLRDGKASLDVVKSFRAADLHRPEHPLHLWGILGGSKDAQTFAAARQRLLDRPALRRDDAAYETFTPEGYARWYRTGFAFEPTPTGPLDVVLAPDRPASVVRLRGPQTCDSGVLSNRLEGAIRSPSFVIERDHILYRVAGKGARVNLIIDGFQQIRDPIYGGLTFRVDHGDDWRWHQQNVSMWKGLRAYIEVLDEGDGFAALDRVLFSNAGPPPVGLNPVMQRLLQDESLTSSDRLAECLGEVLRDVVRDWQRGDIDADEAALLNGLLHNPLLAALGRDEKADTDLAGLARQIQEREAKLPRPRRGLGLCDGSGVDECVYIRGNHKNLGPAVPRHFLVALSKPEQTPHARGSGRLELADRLLSPTNPLTARVIVNRLWHHHFGRGLVASVDNLGIQGEPPTYPALLDWLADEFVRQGWSLKAMHRLMVLSATYQMSSRGDATAEAKDPANHLWHRMPVRRLEAEAIRDAMLALSGRLDRRMYGRGPNPFLTEHMQGRGRPGSGPLDGDGRRSLYLNVRRNFLNPLFLAFDYPVPFSSMGRRSVSNVPAQALTLLNNPFVVQEARRWAERTLAIPGTIDARLTHMYQSAFGRTPTATELADARGFLTAQAQEYGKSDDVRAWADLAHVLFNVKEFIFVE